MVFTFGFSEDFTWSSIALAISGGILLGCSVVFKTACLSGVLGISNYTKRLVVQPEAKRYLFIFGMLVGSFLLSLGFEGTDKLPIPGTGPAERVNIFLRMAFGAFFVGFGAALQHGCTSGHGLTGLARLSPRSWVAVPVFMGVGLVSGTLLQSGSAMPPQILKNQPAWYVGSILAASLACFLLVLGALLWVVGRRGSPSALKIGLFVGEFVVGATFGAGLLISGMARVSKVAGFLDVASGNWDLSLPFVMMGGLSITFPYFQAVRWCGLQKKSFLTSDDLDLPPVDRMPDRTLALGAALFGFGWAICGVCPGPMWVNLAANPSWEVLVGVICLTAGLSAQELFKSTRTLLARSKSENTSSESSDGATPTSAEAAGSKSKSTNDKPKYDRTDSGHSDVMGNKLTKMSTTSTDEGTEGNVFESQASSQD